MRRIIRGMRCCWTGILLSLLLIAGCTHTRRPPVSLGQQIAQAHRGELARSHEGIAAVVHLELPGLTPRFFDARFTHHFRDGRTRMLLPDDTVLVWDGQHGWVAPASSQVSNPLAKLNIWPTLVTLPLKLDHPATRFTEPQSTRMAGVDYLLTQVIAGDAKGFILYVDPQSKLIRHIVIPARFAAQIESSFDKPVAVSHYNFQSIEGAPFPESWRLWAWNPEDGIHGGPLGEVRVYNIEFVTPGPTAFVPPAGARQVR